MDMYKMNILLMQEMQKMQKRNLQLMNMIRTSLTMQETTEQVLSLDLINNQSLKALFHCQQPKPNLSHCPKNKK